MDAEYWLGRWRDARIGWHEADGSPILRAHLARLRLGPGTRVLVPLCGKTHDLAVLAGTGASVVGCELSESAALAFFAEHGFEPTRSGGGTRVQLSAGPIELVVGDFFAETPATLGRFDAVFDRAARIALPPAMRPRYAEKVAELAPGGRALVVLFEHDAPGLEPPFSVRESELREAHANARIEPLETAEVFDPAGNSAEPKAVEPSARPNLAKRGATFTRESAYFLDGL